MSAEPSPWKADVAPYVPVDTIIEKILKIRGGTITDSARLTQNEVLSLLGQVKKIFKEEPTLLEIHPPITICGDTHGQFLDLIRIFEKADYPPNTRYLFLGDYVDRGKQSIETVCLLFCYKVKYPGDIFLLRGNHECAYINKVYGFLDDLNGNYGCDGGMLWQEFGDVFNWLPIAAIINDKIFCVHGGISPELKSLDDIRNLHRPEDIPDRGLLCDLLWSDPDPEVETWDDNERGTGQVFGLEPVDQFLAKFDFDLICRAHQAVMGGYEFPFGQENAIEPNQSVITLFSAPNYCYEYENRGAVLHVNKELYCSFTILDPVFPVGRNPDDWMEPMERPGTPPRAGSTDVQPVQEFSLETYE